MQSKGKLRKAIIMLFILLGIMFMEYRYIMVHQVIHKANDHHFYVEIFGRIDEYYVE